MAEEKKYYVTKDGLEKIREEYENLKSIKLSKTNGEVPKILHSEDLNPEYLAFQEDLDSLENRISDLGFILKNTQLIKSPTGMKQNTINLGAKVLVQIGNQTDELQIVGTLEANPAIGKISNESPVGQALLGHKAGEEVAVSSPIKTIYKIKKVKYNLS